jgi:hypothetical protein
MNGVLARGDIYHFLTDMDHNSYRGGFPRQFGSRSPLHVVLILIVIVAASFAGCGSGDTNQPQDSAADSVSVVLSGVDSVSVFDLLKENHAVDYRSTMAGVFVTGIDSVNNCRQAYWIYTINDTTPQVAADKMLTRDGNRVVWHFRKVE